MAMHWLRMGAGWVVALGVTGCTSLGTPPGTVVTRPNPSIPSRANPNPVASTAKTNQPINASAWNTMPANGRTPTPPTLTPMGTPPSNVQPTNGIQPVSGIGPGSASGGMSPLPALTPAPSGGSPNGALPGGISSSSGPTNSGDAARKPEMPAALAVNVPKPADALKPAITPAKGDDPLPAPPLPAPANMEIAPPVPQPATGLAIQPVLLNPPPVKPAAQVN